MRAFETQSEQKIPRDYRIREAGVKTSVFIEWTDLPGGQKGYTDDYIVDYYKLDSVVGYSWSIKRKSDHVTVASGEKFGYEQDVKDEVEKELQKVIDQGPISPKNEYGGIDVKLIQQDSETWRVDEQTPYTGQGFQLWFYSKDDAMNFIENAGMSIVSKTAAGYIADPADYQEMGIGAPGIEDIDDQELLDFNGEPIVDGATYSFPDGESFVCKGNEAFFEDGSEAFIVDLDVQNASRIASVKNASVKVAWEEEDDFYGTPEYEEALADFEDTVAANPSMIPTSVSADAIDQLSGEEFAWMLDELISMGYIYAEADGDEINFQFDNWDSNADSVIQKAVGSRTSSVKKAYGSDDPNKPFITRLPNGNLSYDLSNTERMYQFHESGEMEYAVDNLFSWILRGLYKVPTTVPGMEKLDWNDLNELTSWLEADGYMTLIDDGELNYDFSPNWDAGADKICQDFMDYWYEENGIDPATGDLISTSSVKSSAWDDDGEYDPSDWQSMSASDRNVFYTLPGFSDDLDDFADKVISGQEKIPTSIPGVNDLDESSLGVLFQLLMDDGYIVPENTASGFVFSFANPWPAEADDDVQRFLDDQG